MPNDTLPYRAPHAAPDAPSEGPREDLGTVDLPLVGEVSGELRLDRPIHLELDRNTATVVPGGGLVLRGDEVPTVDLRALHVDLVDGLVRSEAAGLGPFFDRFATVVLCSALRQALGWKPGTSATGALARRLPQSRRRFPRASVKFAEETSVALDVAGDAVTLTLSRPALLRVLGLPLKVMGLRLEFATGKVTAETEGVGPLRRGLLRLGAWALTKWLRPKIPAAMLRPGYDLLRDPARREHVQALVERLRGGKKKDEDATAEMGAGAGKFPHTLARAGEGGKAGLLGIVSTTKAAIVGALMSVRITADDVPAQTRVLAHLPLGPLSRLGLCTDTGGEVMVVKTSGGLRIEAPLGLYLFADQFPELAELRLMRVAISWPKADEGATFELQTQPPLGPLARALIHQAVDKFVTPRLPRERLQQAGLWDEGPHQVLWRHGSPDSHVEVRTRPHAEVRLHHREDTIEIEAPGGIEAAFTGMPLPLAKIRKIVYRRDDGTIEVDGNPGLGAFGQTLGASLLRTRVAPRLPHAFGLAAQRPGERAEAEAAAARAFSATIAALSLPALGKIELRMDPEDTLAATLGPALLTARSERGVLLSAPELELALHVRSVRYDLPSKALLIDASPNPGPYVTALAAMCVEALLLPLLRKGFKLAPDAAAGERWSLFEAMGVRLYLPPGATLTAKRTPDGFDFSASEPVMLDGGGGPVADVALKRVRWVAADDRVVVESEPPAGPLLTRVARRAIDRVVPDALVKTLAKRMALPVPDGESHALPAAPTSPALLQTELAHVGPLAVHVDVREGVELRLEHDRATLRFGTGMVVRAGESAHLVVRGLAATFMPFTVAVESDPATGELEHHLLAQAARSWMAPLLRLLWPADRARTRDGREVLLALGADATWGPLELCVPPGGNAVVRLDHEGVTMRSDAGLFVAGLDWLPNAGVHALRLRFDDGTVDIEVGTIAERFYHEPSPVGPNTAELAAHLIRLGSPHMPTWTQKLGVRVLAPPPALAEDPGRVDVWKASLPGGFAEVRVGMDPIDVLEIRASRQELRFASVRGLRLDLPGLRLRRELYGVRYHMVSGEVQLGECGQLENAIAEGLLRKALAMADPTVASPETMTVGTLLERFPVDEKGRRVLFTEKMISVLLDPATEFVVRVDPKGLLVELDPPLQLDGPAVMDFLLVGLRYDFAGAKFHIDLEKGGVIAGMFSGFLSREGEKILESAVRPLLPARMREPGWNLATDPNPSETLAALVRTLSMGKLGMLAE